jgi:hypothetical protein
MKGPEKMALLQAARAAEAQHRLVASAAQQEREARAAAAQQHARRTRSSRKQLPPRKQHPPRIDSNAYWTRCLKLQYKDALAAPLPARLATLITQLETQDAYADRGSSRARARA